MSKMHLGIFSDRTSAEAAVNQLEQTGYNTKEISIITRDTAVQTHTQDAGDSMAAGAAEGITTGGVIGGLAGLLIGIGALTIPGVGAILIGGPISAALGLTGAAAATVSGAVTGALAGGLVGSLVGLGVPEETAHIYEESIKTGGVLVAVSAHEGNEEEARKIMTDHGADQLRTITVGAK